MPLQFAVPLLQVVPVAQWQAVERPEYEQQGLSPHPTGQPWPVAGAASAGEAMNALRPPLAAGTATPENKEFAVPRRNRRRFMAPTTSRAPLSNRWLMTSLLLRDHL